MRGKGWSLRLRGGRGEAKAGAFAYVGCDGKRTAGNVLPYRSVGDWPDGFFKA